MAATIYMMIKTVGALIEGMNIDADSQTIFVWTMATAESNFPRYPDGCGEIPRGKNAAEKGSAPRDLRL